jgi:hypothetical protein
MDQLIDRDEDHLLLLRVSYYVLAGLGALIALAPAILFAWEFFRALRVVGNVRELHFNPRSGDLGAFLIFVGALALLGSLVAFVTAENIRAHKNRFFCMLVGGMLCLYVPLGTGIGICTLAVLSRPRVKASFGDPRPDPLAPSAPV